MNSQLSRVDYKPFAVDARNKRSDAQINTVNDVYKLDKSG